MDLNQRQLQILRRIADGWQFKQIATELGVTESAVTTAVMRLRQRVGASNAAHLVAIAFRKGLLK